MISELSRHTSFCAITYRWWNIRLYGTFTQQYPIIIENYKWFMDIL